MEKLLTLIFVLITSFSLHARIQITNHPYDILLVGDGFFGVIAQDGSMSYTRDGSFTVLRDGTLVDELGRKLSPGITLPEGTESLEILNDGRVFAYQQGNKFELATIEIFVKDNDNHFNSIAALDKNHYIELQQGKIYVSDL